jgi:hypothetical protein
VPPDAVEQRHAQFGLERTDLSGRSRLAEIQPGRRPGYAAVIHNGNEGSQIAEVHFAITILHKR